MCPTKKEVIYIIDISAFIFRAYYAIRALSNSQGIPTNAVFGCLSMLLNFFKKFKPAYCVVAYDSEAPTFRKEIYPAYKANRSACPEDLVPQFVYIKEMIAALALFSIGKDGFEADDIIASIIAQNKENFDFVVLTGDKDLMQLIDNQVGVYDAMKDKHYDQAAVKEKFGVNPDQILDFLAIQGDASDNIPGIKGIGAKGAAALLTEFGSMAGIYANLDKIKGSKRLKLEEGRESAVLSQQLVKLNETIALDFDIAQAQYTPQDSTALRELVRKLEFKNLENRIQSLFKGSKESSAPLAVNGNLPLSSKISGISFAKAGAGLGATTPPPQLRKMVSATDAASEKAIPLVKTVVIIQESHFLQLVDDIIAQGQFCFWIETDHEEQQYAGMIGLTIMLEASSAWYIPFTPYHQLGKLTLNQCLAGIQTIFAHPRIEKIGWDLKRTSHIFDQHAIPVTLPFLDLSILDYLMRPEDRTVTLASILPRYLAGTTLSEEKQKGGQGVLFRDDSTDTKEVQALFRLLPILTQGIKERNLRPVYDEIENPLIPVLFQMEKDGIALDRERLQLYSKELEVRIATVTAAIYQLADGPFNVNSPKQLAHVLFNQLQLVPPKKTKTGFSTNNDVLHQLTQFHELPQQIIAYRGMVKLKSTYIDALPPLISPRTHRIHTSYIQTGTATGRLSSQRPNLQNIPIRSEDGIRIRESFVPAPGFELMAVDYSQIELRILAHLSEDRYLNDAFQHNRDIHTETAMKVFTLAETEINAEHRRKAKAINFGIIYGQTPFGLSQELGISRKEAEAFIDRYFSVFDRVKTYCDQVIAECEQRGETQTLFGRKRILPDINSTNKQKKALAARMAVNTTIQGTAADLIKMAMIRVFKHLLPYKSRMLLQVHDELVFEIADPEKDQMIAIIPQLMRDVYPLSVPLEVSWQIGANWREAH